MTKVIPGAIVLLSVPIGMFVGVFFGHMALGSAIGGGLGFATGLTALLWMRKRPSA
jgi:hypothetical protein